MELQSPPYFRIAPTQKKRICKFRLVISRHPKAAQQNVKVTLFLLKRFADAEAAPIKCAGRESAGRLTDYHIESAGRLTDSHIESAGRPTDSQIQGVSGFV